MHEIVGYFHGEQMSNCSTWEPGRRLMLAVLNRVLADLSTSGPTTRDSERESAQAWLVKELSTDEDWPFSFRNVCAEFGWRVEETREQLLGIVKDRKRTGYKPSIHWCD
jgi:hypothetical protein